MHPPREHVLFVHAHPDDETITTGGSIATLLDAGASVTLVTCTRGELGEVIPAELQHLSGDALGAHRETELVSAMSVLGLGDYRFLGDAGACAEGEAVHRFRDSGMQWGPDGPEPLAVTSSAVPVDDAADAFSLTAADIDSVILDICAVINDVRPTAVISYDSSGGYGHPDHVRTHEAACVAAFMMGVPFYEIVPAGQENPHDVHVDVSEVFDRKRKALQAYRTQLTVEGDTIVHVGGQREKIGEIEVFRRWKEPSDSRFDWQQFGLMNKVVTCFFAFVTGVVVGFVGTANHRVAFATVSLMISAGLLVGLRLLFGGRTPALVAALGLLLAVGLLSTKSAGGSVLVEANVVGFVWQWGVAVIALVVLGFPRLSSPSRDTMKKRADSEKVVDAS